MRRTPLALTLCALSLLAPKLAEAQLAGTQTGQLPNVLLLVDSSGSMERMNDGSMPTCEPGRQTTPNRWGSLVQALTGSFQPFFSCAAVPRTAPEFLENYTGPWYAGSPAGGMRPPDYGYVLPYHRPLTGSGQSLCGVFPDLGHAAQHGATGANALASFGVELAAPRGHSNAACVFDQADDGQLDIARSMVRFGLMTFDADPSPALDAGGGWSYFRGSPARGQLPQCPVLDNEVGARSTSAPEWEGTLVPFPAADANAQQIAATNERIQRVLAALRPSGATPLAGMMHDARTFLLEDPNGPRQADPYFPGCRPQYVILLTDGAPNLDLRPECAAPGGNCPYPESAKDVAFDLRMKGIPTFVIGFSVNGDVGQSSPFPGGANSCTQWFEQSTQALPTATAKAQRFADICQAAAPARESAAAACCTLHELSIHGNTEPALFAESQADLAEAFATILGRITQRASTRTVPVYSTVSNASGDTASFFASFAPSATRPWSGSLDRQRLVCGADGLRTAADIDGNEGDRLAENLTQQNGAGRRRFLLANANVQSGIADPSVTLRRKDTGPQATDFDAAELQENFYRGSALAAFDDGLLATHTLAIQAGDCRRSVDRDNAVVPPLSSADCAKVALGFATASTNGLNFSGAVDGQSIGYDFAKLRCPAGDCTPMGAIFRAEPAYAGVPNEPLRDDSFQQFALQQAERPPVLYAATTDGLLHAFQANARGSAQRHTELWSFIPPAILPHLRANVPRGNQLLLDGSPVVRNVIYERTKANASFESLVSTAKNAWRTALVAGFGDGVRGYYALDVTNPGPGRYDPTTGEGSGEWRREFYDMGSGQVTGPHMLWQWTSLPEASGGTQNGLQVGTDANGKRVYSLFGKRTAKPVITTLYFTPEGAQEPREIAVAILPGGIDEGTAQDGECTRKLNTFVRAGTVPADLSPSEAPARPSIRRWASSCSAPVAGRSLSIVRLDNGELIRTFAPLQDVPGTLMNGAAPGPRVIETPLDSPLSGNPVVYPTGLGSIGQKVLIGDADGTVWRFDVTSSNPNEWTGSLFFDTQSPSLASPREQTKASLNGQPIVVTPVAALTDRGELMVGVATGEQELFVEPRGTDNFIYSLTESRRCEAGKSVCTQLNWYVPLTAGERVTGPMSVFDRVLYFATYSPARASNTQCRNGVATLWGMDYTLPLEAAALARGGAARLPRLGESQFDQRQEAGSELIPGVSIRQIPACSDVNLPEYGGAAAANAVFSPGSYQLVIPRATAATGGANTVQGAQTNVETRTLQTMSTPTRLDSFAALVE